MLLYHKFKPINISFLGDISFMRSFAYAQDDKADLSLKMAIQ